MAKHATTDQEINNCFAVMNELRPHLKPGEFVALIREMEREGFKLAYIEVDGEVAAVTGYRISTNLFMGKNLYVDDLVTVQKHRSKGYGEQLLGFVRNIAREEGCSTLHLDSGTQRRQAHKFYFHQNMLITSYHFVEKMD